MHSRAPRFSADESEVVIVSYDGLQALLRDHDRLITRRSWCPRRRQLPGALNHWGGIAPPCGGRFASGERVRLRLVREGGEANGKTGT